MIFNNNLIDNLKLYIIIIFNNNLINNLKLIDEDNRIITFISDKENMIEKLILN